MPEYLHPSISSRIIDKSFTFASAQGATTGFFAFFSERGEDNVIRKVTSPEEFAYFYGEPNYRFSGQMPLNIMRWLRSSGTALCLRLMPDDATLATSVVAVKVKDDNGTLRINPTVVDLASPAVSINALETAVNLLTGTVDADGFTIYPLFAVASKGRGTAYNSIGWRLSPINSLDDTYPDFRLFELEFTESLASGAEVVTGGPYKVALNPEAVSVARESMNIADVVAKYDDRHTVIFFEESYNDLSDALGVNPDLVDFVSNSPQVLNGVAVDPFDGVVVEFMNESLQYLSREDGGLDGNGNQVWNNVVPLATADASYVNMTQPTYLTDGVNTAVNGGVIGYNVQKSLLIKAYNGAIDSGITDKKLYQVDVVLDANYEPEVKNAMAALCRDVRRDCVAILDTQITATFQQAIDYRRSNLSFSTFYAAIFCQDFVVYDEYSGRDVQVTSTYFLADKIPSIDERYGIHWPFVGPRRGNISGFKAAGWFPTEPQKEDLYKAQVNYVEQDPRSTKFMSQLTSQLQMSALSNLSSVRALMRIQREIEQIAEDYPFEFNDAETMAALSDSLNGTLQKWVANRACEYLNVQVYASEYDKQQKVMRIRVDLKFTGIVERILADIVVNK